MRFVLFCFLFFKFCFKLLFRYWSEILMLFANISNAKLMLVNFNAQILVPVWNCFSSYKKPNFREISLFSIFFRRFFFLNLPYLIQSDLISDYEYVKAVGMAWDALKGSISELSRTIVCVALSPKLDNILCIVSVYHCESLLIV